MKQIVSRHSEMKKIVKYSKFRVLNVITISFDSILTAMTTHCTTQGNVRIGEGIYDFHRYFIVLTKHDIVYIGLAKLEVFKYVRSCMNNSNQRYQAYKLIRQTRVLST